MNAATTSKTTLETLNASIEASLAAKMAAINTIIDHTNPAYYERAVSTEPRPPAQPLGRRNAVMGITIEQYWGGR